MRHGKNLYRDTAALAMPKGRRVGQPGHEIALGYLEARLRDIGLSFFSETSFRQVFQGVGELGHGIEFTNLVGFIPGKAPDRESRKQVLIGAHYDSVIDAPCADDNATAVAVVLAMAESVSRQPLNSDLIVVLFDSEEPPWFMGPDMGSIRFVADNAERLNLAGAFILDLIGHDIVTPGFKLGRFLPRIRNLLFVLGLESHRSIVDTVDGARYGERGLTVFPTLNRYVHDLSDHYAFRGAGFPFLFLTCAQGEHYHMPADDMDWVNMRKVRRVNRYLRSLVYSLDNVTGRTETPSGSRTEDSAQFEIESIRRNLGWMFPLFLKLIGLAQLKTRDDIDVMAATLTNMFMGVSLEPVEELDPLDEQDD